MKQGRTLVDLAVEIQRQHEAKRDYLVPTEKMEMATDARTVAFRNQDQMVYSRVLPTAHTQLAERLQIPIKYYRKLQEEMPDLLAENVNRHLRQYPENRMVRTLDGQFRAFLSDKYQRIDNYDVVNRVLPVFNNLGGIKVEACEVTEQRLYIKVVSTTTRLEVPNSKRVGDFVESGVMISNSEIGMGALAIKPFFHFLVCTNGMVRNNASMRACHVGRRQDLTEGEDVAALLSDTTRQLEDKAILSKLEDILKASMDHVRFNEAVQLMGQTAEQKLDGDIQKTVQKTATLLKLNETETSDVFRHLIEGGDLSRWGLINAVTRTAEDAESFDRATEIETAGGILLDLPASPWKELVAA